MSKLLNTLVSSLDRWPVTRDECRDASNHVIYFHRQPDGRVVALTMFPLDPEMVTWEQWEQENISLLAPVVSIFLEVIRRESQSL
jgi:hypothetical protein